MVKPRKAGRASTSGTKPRIAKRAIPSGAKPRIVKRASPSGAKPRVFPAHAAAALFLERQHLARPRGEKLTPRRLEQFVADVGGLQIDSINVLDRAHYLTLWSRFGVYDRAALDRMIYRRRVLFEYWAHAACFVPASHVAAWRRAMLDYGTHHTGWSKFLRKNEKMLAEIEDAIRERGPLGNSDFGERKKGAAGWWSWKPSTHALHYLWMRGRTLSHSRTHFQKRFAIADSVLPAFQSVTPRTGEEIARWPVRTSLHAMGAATETDLLLYLTFPRYKAVVRRTWLKNLVASGEVTEVAIEGDRARWFALTEDLPQLARAARRRPGPVSHGTAFLAPFDSFLWHRARTAKLFGFDYTIEVYVPGHKRVHGYYSLPILHDGRLIGRLDAKAHREARRLEVRHAHFEPWFANGATPPVPHWGAVDRDGALAGVADALRSLAAFVGADRVTIAKVTPSRLRPALAIPA
ncbi:MAG TPA: crosslink repair DNA glycosylase YcaQ family protein [Candidatus Udaeobacter sp.]|nr:crosslink repair DNA glycosylase YcaQ family protein [Candidatus Udaeobacter sp.]